MTTKHSVLFIFTMVTIIAIVTVGVSQARPAAVTLNSSQADIGAGFTYQGYLTDSSLPANGYYDLNFDLYDEETGGKLLESILIEDWEVEQGIFTVTLNFGIGFFEGEARWLEIGVRPYDDPGAFTILSGRQPLNPTPYALYAVNAGGVHWGNITGIPTYLLDGDDDTTYSPGTGLDLTDTTFNVDTAEIQARITGDCDVGSTIQSINEDGTVECESHDTRPVFNQIALDITEYVGWDSSITIGADGLPIISYVNYTNGDLITAHCQDPACESATLTTIDDTADFYYTSITIGSDGFPVISYYDYDNQNLKVAHCSSPDCSSSTTTTVDASPNDVGLYTSITIGVDGFPIISYFDQSLQNLKTAHCTNITCTSADLHSPDTVNNVGLYSSITIGHDGLPIISEYSSTNLDLRILKCANLACTSIESIHSLDSSNSVGEYSSIAIGIDGLPIISYRSATGSELKVAHCNTDTCSSATLSILGTSEDGYDTCLTIDSEGLPVISYVDSSDNLKFARCYDITCTSANIVTLDTSSGHGFGTGITIGVDGFPIISYYDPINGYLKVNHCSNLFCLPYWRSR